MTWYEIAITIIASFMASSGFWAYIQHRSEKKSAKTRMILGLGHDRIISLCQHYIERGWITFSEYENLNKYLFKPYEDMGGNGVAKRLMAIVSNLPMRADNYNIGGNQRHP